MENEKNQPPSPKQFLDAYKTLMTIENSHYKSLSEPERLRLMAQAIDMAKHSKGNVYNHFEQLILERQR